MNKQNPGGLAGKISELLVVPDELFISDDAVTGEVLKKLKNRMHDDIAEAFGGPTSDGGYIIDGDLADETPERRLSFLQYLHKKYEKKVQGIRSG
ncbi:MAG TPA: hypothetical protein PK514_05925 [Spirochaetota bacterium]|nr:hypothetical protein [Spirochaetota bacterium]